MRRPLGTRLVLAAFVTTLAAAACGSSPGDVITVGAPPTAATGAYQALATASPTTPAAAGAGPLRTSVLRSILDELNRNTAETERGEYLILNALGATLRDQIDALLRR